MYLPYQTLRPLSCCKFYSIWPPSNCKIIMSTYGVVGKILCGLRLTKKKRFCCRKYLLLILFPSSPIYNTIFWSLIIPPLSDNNIIWFIIICISSNDFLYVVESQKKCWCKFYNLSRFKPISSSVFKNHIFI